MKEGTSIYWITGGFVLLIVVLVIVTNTVPYFEEPRKIDPNDCNTVARDRASKAVSVQDQYPELVEQKGDFQAYYNAFFEICIRSGI